MILNRDTGLALDAGADTHAGDHPVLWQVHAAPWQQWRLRRVGKEEVEIVNESDGLRLTTTAAAYDGGGIWLDKKERSDWSTRWRLKQTKDRVAFLIQNAVSGHSLDSGKDAEKLRKPYMSASHWTTWQQWIVVRLPLA